MKSGIIVYANKNHDFLTQDSQLNTQIPKYPNKRIHHYTITPVDQKLKTKNHQPKTTNDQLKTNTRIHD